MTRAESGAGGPAHEASCPAGADDDYCCCVCQGHINIIGRRDAYVWSDPGGEWCLAHGDCLRRLGEQDLGLR